MKGPATPQDLRHSMYQFMGHYFLNLPPSVVQETIGMSVTWNF